MTQSVESKLIECALRNGSGNQDFWRSHKRMAKSLNRRSIRALQLHDHFDFRRLRKHVERRDGFDFESRLQLGEIARKSGWIKRNINQRRRGQIDNPFLELCAQTDRRWIDDSLGLVGVAFSQD